MEVAAARKPINRKKKKIPSNLIYEVMDGKPIYYKGYKNALLNKNKFNEMGCSSLQAEIISFLLEFLYSVIDKKKYKIHTNQVGIHISTENNLSGDIVIYEKTVLTPDRITNKYADVPPFIQIEIDISADLEDFGGEYMSTKVNKLLDFGTQKIIWISSAAQRVLVATPNSDWLSINWNKDIEIMDGHTFNIGQYLAQQGIQLDNK